jgi:predicted dehydrogenase
MSLRLGLFGSGRWGQNIKRELLSLPNVTVATLARGETVRPEFDAVLVATPSATHAEVSLPYIEAGIATFIEKPMVTSAADAQRIRAAAKKSGALVFVGHIFLYNPAFRAALELLPQLGAIEYVTCEGANCSPRTDSSVLWDWLPHDLSMAQAIFDGRPDSVTAWSLCGGKMPKAAVCKFQFGARSLVSTISWLSPARSKKTTIVCEHATLVFDDRAERRLALYRVNGEISYPSYGPQSPLKEEIDAFLRAVRSGRAGASDLEVAAGIVDAIAAAERSIAHTGQLIAT